MFIPLVWVGTWPLGAAPGQWYLITRTGTAYRILYISHLSSIEIYIKIRKILWGHRSAFLQGSESLDTDLRPVNI